MRSDHGVQKDPEAIREVRRILREHVGLAAGPPPRYGAEPAPGYRTATAEIPACKLEAVRPVARRLKLR